MLDFLPYLAVALLYCLVAFIQWHPRRFGGKLQQRIAVACGLALHGLLLFRDVLTGSGINFSLVNALSAIAWLTVLIYWIASLRYELHALQAFVLPPAALFALLQGGATEHHILPYTGDALFAAHLIIALLAYSLFTFAALHAGLMAIAERQLHHKKPWLRLPEFPPIMPMERLLFQVILLGYLLLTFTLVSGIFFSEQLFHQPLKFNHKTIFSIAAWLIFGALLWGRHAYGWRGRTAIRWTLGGFVLLLLAYVGTKFVLEVLLGR